MSHDSARSDALRLLWTVRNIYYAEKHDGEEAFARGDFHRGARRPHH